MKKIQKLDKLIQKLESSNGVSDFIQRDSGAVTFNYGDGKNSYFGRLVPSKPLVNEALAIDILGGKDQVLELIPLNGGEIFECYITSPLLGPNRAFVPTQLYSNEALTQKYLGAIKFLNDLDVKISTDEAYRLPKSYQVA